MVKIMQIDFSSWIPVLMAKVCHDMASSLLSLGWGVEGLQSTSCDPQTIRSLQQNSDNAQNRLKMYRLMFTPKASFSEVQGALEKTAQDKNIKVKWQSLYLDDDRMTPLILKLFLIGSEALNRGGQVNIKMDDDIILEFISTQTPPSANITWKQEYIDFIKDKEKALMSEPDPRRILTMYAHYICEGLGKEICYKKSGNNSFILSIKKASRKLHVANGTNI